MPNRKISDNPALLAAGLADDDLLHIIDVSQAADIDKNSQIEFSELVTRMGTELEQGRVSVSANDADTGFLSTKIIGTAGLISVTEVNDGLSEQLQINFIGGTLGEDYVDINSVGTLPSAGGADAIAIGNNAIQTLGSNGILIGNNTFGGSLNSIAIGGGANVGSVGGADIAIGGNASVTATGGDMIAIGDGATVVDDTGPGNGTIVIGSSTATGNSNLLIGNNSSVNSDQNVLLGNQFTALTDDNVAIGYAIQIGSSVGTQTLVGSQINNLSAGGGGNVVVGFSSSALGDASVTVGSLAACPGDDAVQLGTGTNTTDDSLQFRNKQIATLDGVQVETGSGTPVSTPVDGHLYVDTVDNKLFFRSSATWFPTTVRTILTANTTIYANSTTGNDSNDGLSPGAPVLTLQRAIDIASELDPQAFTLDIQLADGTYDTQTDVILKKNLAANGVVIRGNAADNTAVIIDNSSVTSSFGTLVNQSNTWVLDDLTITNSAAATAGGNYCLRLTQGFLGLRNVRLLGAGNTQGMIIAQQGIVTLASQPLDIEGTFAGLFINCAQSGAVQFDASTITFISSPTMNQYLGLTGCSVYQQIATTFVNTVTGTRYTAKHNSAIITDNGLDTDVPGSVAGTLSSGAVIAVP